MLTIIFSVPSQILTEIKIFQMQTFQIKSRRLRNKNMADKDYMMTLITCY